MRRTQIVYFFQAKKKANDNDNVWYTKQPIGENTFRAWFKEACTKTGLDVEGKRLVPHSLKSTMATALARAGASKEESQRISGNKQPPSSYVNPHPERRAELSNQVFGDSFKGMISKQAQPLPALPPPQNQPKPLPQPIPALPYLNNQPKPLPLSYSNQSSQVIPYTGPPPPRRPPISHRHSSSTSMIEESQHLQFYGNQIQNVTINVNHYQPPPKRARKSISTTTHSQVTEKEREEKEKMLAVWNDPDQCPWFADSQEESLEE